GLAAAQPAGHAQHHAEPAASAPAAASRAPAAGTPPSARDGGPHAYRSAFDGYRRHAEQPVQSWREANDTVGRIGGWQAYAREAQGTAPPAAATPASGAPAGSHAGHR
ncbi:MAG TPA: hypothetical protein VGE16_16895, partial [Albitalea sp.]